MGYSLDRLIVRQQSSLSSSRKTYTDKSKPSERPVHLAEGEVPRKADLRAFVLTGRDTRVWPSGLTRYSREEGNAIVNSSQGGGFKDTWVLKS